MEGEALERIQVQNKAPLGKTEKIQAMCVTGGHGWLAQEKPKTDRQTDSQSGGILGEEPAGNRIRDGTVYIRPKTP